MLQVSLHPPESWLLIIYRHTLGLMPGKRARFRANVESVSTVMIKTAVARDWAPLLSGRASSQGVEDGVLVFTNRNVAF